jgi:hypothetical protein
MKHIYIHGHGSVEKRVELKPIPSKATVVVYAPEGAAISDSFYAIRYIGATSDDGWNLNQATKAITASFGQPNAGAPTNYSLSPVDIVFDTQNTELYIETRNQAAQGAAQTILDARNNDAVLNY